MRLSRTSIAALLVVLAAASGGCTLVNRVRAKNALNEGARAYKDGRFADAEQSFRTAFDLDPSQPAARVLDHLLDPRSRHGTSLAGDICYAPA